MIFNKINKNATIANPSIIHAYSLGMEFIQLWFFNTIDRKYFKAIHLSDRDAFDAFRTYDPVESLKVNTPSLAIDSRLDNDYFNDPANTYEGGIENFIVRSREASFFNDRKRNLKISLNSQTIKINYNFRIRVNTKLLQHELAYYLRRNLRIGETQSRDFDMDFHVPKQIMLQLASDAGFELTEDKKNIKDVHKFLKYANQHSHFPITYKLRTSTQQMEFFIRIMDVSFHVSCLENMSLDDGERFNMTTGNYIIEIPVVLTMSAPRMYIYYSDTKHEFMMPDLDDINPELAHIALHTIRIPSIKEVNDKGWNLFITADYDLFDTPEDSRNYNEEYNYIDFHKLIEKSDIDMVFNKVKEIYVHPTTFLDFKAYALGTELELDMNWDNLVAKFKQVKGIMKIAVCLYVNKQYVNETLLKMTNDKDNRLTPTSEDRFDHFRG